MTGHNPRGSCPVGFNRANFAEFVLSLVNQSTDFPRQSKTPSPRSRRRADGMINMFGVRPTYVSTYISTVRKLLGVLKNKNKKKPRKNYHCDICNNGVNSVRLNRATTIFFPKQFLILLVLLNQFNIN